MEGKSKLYRQLSLPVVGGGVGAAVVVVGFGFPFLMQRIEHFPPLEPFLASVETLMLKSPVTVALYFPFLLQSLGNSMLRTIYSTKIMFSLRDSFPFVRYNCFVSHAGFPFSLHLEGALKLGPGAGVHHVVRLAVHVVRGLLRHHEGQFSFIVDLDRLLRLILGTLVLWGEIFNHLTSNLILFYLL